MKTRFKFIDPGAIMGVVVSLIILAVGVFAFYAVISAIEVNQTEAQEALSNIPVGGDKVFNILGVVLIIGAIMAIVGLVYNYVGDFDKPKKRKRPKKVYHKRIRTNLNDTEPHAKKELPMLEDVDEKKVKSKKSKKQRGNFEEWE